MKKSLIIFLYILANLLLFLVTFVFHNNVTVHLMRPSVNPESFEIFLWVIDGMIYFFYLVVGPNNKIKAISPGLFTLSWTLFLFFIFQLNKTFSRKGEYRSFPVSGVDVGSGTIHLRFDEHYYPGTPVTQDKIYLVDTAEVRIDKGLFGIEVYTNELYFRTKTSTDAFKTADTLHYNPHYTNEAEYYAYRRCFECALREYSKRVAKDSLNDQHYYNKGVIELVMHNYEKAKCDFKQGLRLLCDRLGESKLKELGKIEEQKYVDELIRKVEQNEFGGVEDQVINLNSIDLLKLYHLRIRFCNEQLETETTDKK